MATASIAVKRMENKGRKNRKKQQQQEELGTNRPAGKNKKNGRKKTAATRRLMSQTKMTSFLYSPFPNRFELRLLLFQAGLVIGRRRHERRCKQIFDALETCYHKGGIGRLLYNASNIIERKMNLQEETSYTFIYKMTEIDGEYLATTFISNED